jgi:hypothetical protein
MRKRLALLLLPLLFCGCAEMAGSLIDSAVDNGGPAFTGERPGEYRDRKEVDRLGSVGAFRRKHHREPNLYWPAGLSSSDVASDE